MGHGHSLLQAIIRDGAASRLSLFDERFFLEEELPLYHFVTTHKAQFGVLPDDAAIREAGFTMAPLRQAQPVAYYEDRIQRRMVYNAFSALMPELTSALRAQDTDSLLNSVREVLSSVGSAQSTNHVTTYEDEVRAVQAEYALAKATRGRLRGITFGYEPLDEVTLGAQGGDLIVIAGRPAVGKTSILSKACHSAWVTGTNALFLSMEMNKLSITRRMVGIDTGLNPKLIRSGMLSRWGEEILAGAATREGCGRLYLESGDATRSVDGIESAIQQFSPEALYVDAAYLLSPAGAKNGYVSRWEQLSEVIRELKALAMQYNIPIFISVQFNRNQKDSGGTAALDLGDIAGTDSIPQDASIVIGLRRALEPYTQTRRRVELMKNREGDPVEFMIHYLFEPVNLGQVVEEEEGSTVNVDWMT